MSSATQSKAGQMTSRARPTSSLPKAPTNLSPKAVIADTAVLTGLHLITIGANAVLHPRARVNSTYAPVTIGAGCVVSERACVGLLQEPDDNEGGEGEKGDAEERSGDADVGPGRENSRDGVVLEENVVLEPAAIVEAARVGQSTVMEAGSKIGAGAVIGKHCRITPLCEVKPQATLPDYTIVYGNSQTRLEKPGLEGLRAKTHEKQLEVLRRLIPSNLVKWQSG